MDIKNCWVQLGTKERRYLNFPLLYWSPLGVCVHLPLVVLRVTDVQGPVCWRDRGTGCTSMKMALKHCVHWTPYIYHFCSAFTNPQPFPLNSTEMPKDWQEISQLVEMWSQNKLGTQALHVTYLAQGSWRISWARGGVWTIVLLANNGPISHWILLWHTFRCLAFPGSFSCLFHT